MAKKKQPPQKHQPFIGNRVLFTVPRRNFNNSLLVAGGVALALIGLLIILQPNFFKNRLEAWEAAFATTEKEARTSPRPTAWELTEKDDLSNQVNLIKGWNKPLFDEIKPAAKIYDNDGKVIGFSPGTLYKDISGKLPKPSKRIATDRDDKTELTLTWETASSDDNYATLTVTVDQASDKIIEKTFYTNEN